MINVYIYYIIYAYVYTVCIFTYIQMYTNVFFPVFFVDPAFDCIVSVPETPAPALSSRTKLCSKPSTWRDLFQLPGYHWIVADFV